MNSLNVKKKIKERFSCYLHRHCLVLKSSSKFIGSLGMFRGQGILDPYKDMEKEIVVNFELELTDRLTKYILEDISNLSWLCDYGFHHYKKC